MSSPYVLTFTKLPMMEAVKHPGVLLIFSVGNLGAGSAKLLNKWRAVCQNAQKWGGKVLLAIPFDCDAWHRNSVFAKFCLDFGLEWVQRKDQEMAFVTNCKIIRTCPDDLGLCSEVF